MGRSIPSEDLNLLLPRCRRGDQEAFLEAYRLVGSSLYGSALRILRQPQDAEDAVQETFVRFFQKVRSIRTGNLNGWLHRVTVNLVLGQVNWEADHFALPAPVRFARRKDAGPLHDAGHAHATVPAGSLAAPKRSNAAGMIAVNHPGTIITGKDNEGVFSHARLLERGENLAGGPIDFVENVAVFPLFGSALVLG